MKRVSVSLLVVGLLAGARAGADTMKLFKGPTYQPFSPLVAYNPDADNFLVLGFEGSVLQSRRSGLLGSGQGRWRLAPKDLGDRYSYPLHLAYNSDTRSYLVADYVYMRLNRRGAVVDEDLIPGTFFPRTLALTAMPGKKRWFAWLEECKYGCWYYGQLIGPGGGLSEPILFPLDAMKDKYANERKWIAGYDSEDKTILLVWEDRLDENYEGPSRAIRGQRFKKNGRTVGGPIKIAKHKRDASEPDMVYNAERDEWFVVYRRDSKIKARFLRDGTLSAPFKVSGSKAATVPSVAYSPYRDTYLVTWVEGAPEGGVYGRAGLYGRWVRVDGTPFGQPFVVNDKAGDQYVRESGHSACNDSGACLVTWINDGERGNTRGRYLRVP